MKTQTKSIISIIFHTIYLTVFIFIVGSELVATGITEQTIKVVVALFFITLNIRVIISEAKKLLPLLFFLPFMSFAQLPTTNQGWTINTGFLYEDVNTGREADYLTFNTGSSTMLDFRSYEWQSPNYNLINQACDSIKVTIKADMNVRQLDQVKLFYIIGTTAYFKIIPSSGVYTYVLPNNIDYFTLSLVTWGGGSLAGKYVRFKTFLIECKNTNLPVTLLNFCAKPAERFNVLHWSTANEINSDYFLLEKSIDCVNWTTLKKFYTGFDSREEKQYSTKDQCVNLTTYYRLIQVDLNGDRTDYGIRSVINDTYGNDKVVTTINSLGQEIDINSEGFKVIKFESGLVIKKSL